jgi:hypothetical protein
MEDFMTLKTLHGTVVWALLPFLMNCSDSKVSKPAAIDQPGAAKAVETPKQETSIQVYDVSQEDITKIPGITSRNISVEGVKLGDRTRDVDKLLGTPIKTESLPKIYRSAYREHGVYLEFDRFTGKVNAIYINTNYYKKVKGDLSELLAHGKLDLLKKSFGENPLESKPDATTVLWDFPGKGIQFVHLKQAGTASYTLKLIEPNA